MEIVHKPNNADWHCAVCKQKDDRPITIIPIRSAKEVENIAKGLIVHIDCLQLSAYEKLDEVNAPNISHMLVQFIS